jgi:hypothetical protein
MLEQLAGKLNPRDAATVRREAGVLLLTYAGLLLLLLLGTTVLVWKVSRCMRPSILQCQSESWPNRVHVAVWLRLTVFYARAEGCVWRILIICSACLAFLYEQRMLNIIKIRGGRIKLSTEWQAAYSIECKNTDVFNHVAKR